MSDNRKYYYLKLKENFYNSETMVILESMQDGLLYSNLLLKMYLMSLKSGGIREILWRFPSENIPQFRNVAVTQDNFVIVCNVEQSQRWSGIGKDQCGKQNACVYQYSHFTVPFRNVIRLQASEYHLRWIPPVLQRLQQRRSALFG